MIIHINNHQQKYKILKNKYKKLVKIVLEEINCFGIFKQNKIELGVTFVNDDEITQLNKKFKDKDTPTDVLAFSYSSENEFYPLKNVEKYFYLGDIVVSVDTAIRQAKQMKHSVEKELFILVIHGILHLCGYDDTESNLKEVMFKKQEELLNKVWNNI